MSGPNSLYNEEKSYVNKLLRAIELAVKEKINNPGRLATRIEQEKLCYFAIKEFDIPVTYSWYLAGAYTRVAGEPNEAADRMNSPNQALQQDVGENADVYEYKDFFTSAEFMDGYELQNIWFTTESEFLRDFYRQCAPDDYVELYIVSIDIREKLKDMIKTIRDKRANRSLSDWDGGSNEGLLSTQDEQELRRLISDLHLELAKFDELSGIIGTMTQATDVLEQMFAQLTSLTSISHEQEVVLNDLAQYFYYDVWRYPALYISTQTAEGPNRHHLIEEHATKFTDFDEELVTAATEMRDQGKNANLYTQPDNHYGSINEEMLATALRTDRTDSLRKYLRNAAHDDRLIQEIASAYYEDEITFEQLKSLVGPEGAANFRVLKRQLDESLTEELTDL
jgi:hypothetical protein